jgi:hypothetical protein
MGTYQTGSSSERTSIASRLSGTSRDSISIPPTPHRCLRHLGVFSPRGLRHLGVFSPRCLLISETTTRTQRTPCCISVLFWCFLIFLRARAIRERLQACEASQLLNPGNFISCCSQNRIRHATIGGGYRASGALATRRDTTLPPGLCAKNEVSCHPRLWLFC